IAKLLQSFKIISISLLNSIYDFKIVLFLVRFFGKMSANVLALHDGCDFKAEYFLLNEDM
ncbi:hypothetical protein J3S90_15530, partial [Flavobacterium sp. P4023]